jgi:hypothetical protein
MVKSTENFIIGMIVPDGFAHVPTFYLAFQVGLYLGKVPRLYISGKGRYGHWDVGRTDVLEQIQKDYPNERYIKMMWIDSDVIVKEPQGFIESIKYAYDHNYNIVGKYHTIQSETIVNCIWRKDSTPYIWSSLSDEDIEALCKEQNTDYPVIEGAGLGMFYGTVDLQYKFHQDKQGEDFWFFTDMKQEVRLATKIELAHWKQIPL